MSNTGYRPLSSEEQNILIEETKTFYAFSQEATKSIEMNNRRIRTLNYRLKTERLGDEETKKIIAQINDYKSGNNTLRRSIKLERPHTPQGERICHLCDIVSQAPTGEIDNDCQMYKCQNSGCNATYRKVDINLF